jgi:hypothetical protein
MIGRRREPPNLYHFDRFVIGERVTGYSVDERRTCIEIVIPHAAAAADRDAFFFSPATQTQVINSDDKK